MYVYFYLSNRQVQLRDSSALGGCSSILFFITRLNAHSTHKSCCHRLWRQRMHDKKRAMGCSPLPAIKHRFPRAIKQVPELNTGPLDTTSTQAAAGLSRLKGVFKSFNGGVEVNVNAYCSAPVSMYVVLYLLGKECVCLYLYRFERWWVGWGFRSCCCWPLSSCLPVILSRVLCFCLFSLAPGRGGQGRAPGGGTIALYIY